MLFVWASVPILHQCHSYLPPWPHERRTESLWLKSKEICLLRAWYGRYHDYYFNRLPHLISIITQFKDTIVIPIFRGNWGRKRLSYFPKVIEPASRRTRRVIVIACGLNKICYMVLLSTLNSPVPGPDNEGEGGRDVWFSLLSHCPHHSNTERKGMNSYLKVFFHPRYI